MEIETKHFIDKLKKKIRRLKIKKNKGGDNHG